MNAPRTARERARAELTQEITEAARKQLAADGAAGLSLRAVARQLGMASSAIYRYFSSRDELLTALILDSYNAVGSHAEAADRGAVKSGATAAGRWLAVSHAVRDWALEHRHEFELLYGTPIPGYAAPMETTTAAARLPLTLAGILNDAFEARTLAPPRGPACPAGIIEAEIRGLGADGLDPTTLALLLRQWSGLVGIIGFELFGHLNGVVSDHTAFFTHTARTAAFELGLPN